MSVDAERILGSHAPNEDPAAYLVAADAFLARGDRHLLASALDRAYGLGPQDDHVIRHRATVLDELAVREHGLTFRYVPAGTFLMGSRSGDPDERPVHPVRLDHFWIAEVPITWAAFCDLMGWSPPPYGAPGEDDPDVPQRGFFLRESNKIRMQYCESETTAAGDWHAHDPSIVVRSADGAVQPGAELFGEPPRDDAARPLAYDEKPMVAVGWEDADELARKLSTNALTYALPTEAQWEKAARGGLIGRRWAWGDEPPTSERCDFGRFGDFRLFDPRRFPPNGYGLHGMCGGVWEWTASVYDALAYHEAASGSSASDQVAARTPAEIQRVLRGGSWTDDAEAITVSFRMGRAGTSWRRGAWSGATTPNVGFRLVRLERPAPDPTSSR